MDRVLLVQLLLHFPPETVPDASRNSNQPSALGIPSQVWNLFGERCT